MAQPIFPDLNINLPAPMAGVLQQQRAEEAQRQMMQQSELGDLELARARANVPLQNAMRERDLGNVRGELERQPYDLSRMKDDAEFKASPTFRDVTKAVELNTEREKLRAQNWKKNADEMDTFAQAMKPVFDRLEAHDVAGANDAWEAAGVILEKHGIDFKGLQKIPMSQLQQHYQHAIKNAPVLRKQYEQYEAHERAKERELLKHQYRISEQKELRKNQDIPTSPNAVVARIQQKYRADPASLSESEQDIFRNHIETSFTRYDQEGNDRLWNEADRLVREEEEKSGKKDKNNRGTKVRNKYQELRRITLSKAYPDLYKTVKPKENQSIDLKSKYGLE